MRDKVFPNDYPLVQEKGVYIFEPYLPKHITHFIENVNHLLNKLGDRSLYPYLSTVYLPWFNETSEYEWSKTYINLLVSLFPADHRPKLIFKNRNKYDYPILQCFSNAVGRIMWLLL